MLFKFIDRIGFQILAGIILTTGAISASPSGIIIGLIVGLADIYRRIKAYEDLVTPPSSKRWAGFSIIGREHRRG